MYLLTYCNFIQSIYDIYHEKTLVSRDGIDQKYDGTPLFRKTKLATLALN